MERHVEPYPDRKNKKSLNELILIIDDCPDALEINRTILEMAGYNVMSAENGKDALTLLFNFARPDLILLDMTMPEMSGTEFLKMLKDKKPEILSSVPIVILSGVDAAPESLVSGFIRKPIPIDKFLTAVRYYVDKGPKGDRYEH